MATCLFMFKGEFDLGEWLDMLSFSLLNHNLFMYTNIVTYNLWLVTPLTTS